MRVPGITGQRGIRSDVRAVLKVRKRRFFAAAARRNKPARANAVRAVAYRVIKQVA